MLGLQYNKPHHHHPQTSTSVVEPYNSVLTTHAAMEFSDVTFLVDNDAVFGICKDKLEVKLFLFSWQCLSCRFRWLLTENWTNWSHKWEETDLCFFLFSPLEKKLPHIFCLWEKVFERNFFFASRWFHLWRPLSASKEPSMWISTRFKRTWWRFFLALRVSLTAGALPKDPLPSCHPCPCYCS